MTHRHATAEHTRRVWAMIAAGCSRPEMAKALGVTKRMVDWYVTYLYSEIGARCVADATRKAIEHRVIVISGLLPRASITYDSFKLIAFLYHRPKEARAA